VSLSTETPAAAAETRSEAAREAEEEAPTPAATQRRGRGSRARCGEPSSAAAGSRDAAQSARAAQRDWDRLTDRRERRRRRSRRATAPRQPRPAARESAEHLPICLSACLRETRRRLGLERSKGRARLGEPSCDRSVPPVKLASSWAGGRTDGRTVRSVDGKAGGRAGRHVWRVSRASN